MLWKDGGKASILSAKNMLILVSKMYYDYTLEHHNIQDHHVVDCSIASSYTAFSFLDSTNQKQQNWLENTVVGKIMWLVARNFFFFFSLIVFLYVIILLSLNMTFELIFPPFHSQVLLFAPYSSMADDFKERKCRRKRKCDFQQIAPHKSNCSWK